MLQNQEVDSNFIEKIIGSNEVHFQMNGYVDKQMSTVWHEFWTEYSVWTIFFGNGDENLISLIGNHYWSFCDLRGLRDVGFSKMIHTAETQLATEVL